MLLSIANHIVNVKITGKTIIIMINSLSFIIIYIILSREKTHNLSSINIPLIVKQFWTRNRVTKILISSLKIYIPNTFTGYSKIIDSQYIGVLIFSPCFKAWAEKEMKHLQNVLSDSGQTLLEKDKSTFVEQFTILKKTIQEVIE